MMMENFLSINRQQKRVLEALSTPGGTTSGELKDLYGIMDGRKRISELRRMGLTINDRMESGVNRYGEQTHFKRYWLEVE